MSKTKLLLDVADGMRSLADSIQALAAVLDLNEPIEPMQQTEVITKPEPVPMAVTLEQVRAVMAEKSQNGFTAEVRGLLEKYGASKLSQIGPTNFAALLADAENLK